MRVSRYFAGLAVAVVLPTTGLCYDWKSHNRTALHGRRVAILAETRPELRDFLDRFGLADLDSRAGDKYKNAFTDEDHNEGFLQAFVNCTYRERDCWNCGATVPNSLWVAPCTLDHFSPRLSLPLPNKDATVHARYYFDMAVKLYKAGKCNTSGLRTHYMQGAARALGHALHLTEDMGAPQHTAPENHVPFPGGHCPSFHEYWTFDLCDGQPATYTKPDGGGDAIVGGFDTAAAAANSPQRRRPEGLMGRLAARPSPSGARPETAEFGEGALRPTMRQLHLTFIYH
jgi:hypothetical protein